MTGTRGPGRVLGAGAGAAAYDVRGDLADATPDRPALLLVGSPMDARVFGTLAGYFADRPVVTYDPPGLRPQPASHCGSHPEDHAGDVHGLIEALGWVRWTSSPAAVERSRPSQGEPEAFAAARREALA